MKSPLRKAAIVGQRRFQWQSGGWFGGVLGGAAWLVPAAAILALHGQPVLALLPAACCLLMVVTGIALWYRRDRLQPFAALLGMAVLFSCLTPLAWFTISQLATDQTLAALNWPQHGLVDALAVLIGPAIIVGLCWLEYADGIPQHASGWASENGEES